ncbi:MAG: GNAT family N-acetyltransferase [Burkholderiaceae bacterium]
MNELRLEPMVPDALFEEIVELDRTNMTAYFSASDDRFDSELRRASLFREWDNDAEFFVYYRQGRLAGYFEVMPAASGKLVVLSLQTDQNYSKLPVLRALFGAGLATLESCPLSTITSSAHSSNVLSVNLHRRLGFEAVGRKVVGQGANRILFEASAQALRRCLGSLVRANRSLQRTLDPAARALPHAVACLKRR